MSGYNAGSAGPDANEAGIESLYSNWGSAPVAGDEYWAKMGDGTIFLDQDEDGYYDDALRWGDGGTWNWDTTSDQWVWHDYPPDGTDGPKKVVMPIT